MRIRFLFFLFLFPILTLAGIMGQRGNDWQGFYFGGNFGAAWGLLSNKLTITNNSNNPLFYPPSIPGLNFSGTNTFNPLRFTIGAQVGYNEELKNSFLAGLEIGYNYTNLEETFHKTYSYSNSPNTRFYTFKNFAAAKQIASLRPRLGYHFEEYLPYISVGGALTNLNFKQTFIDHYYNVTHINQYNKVRYGWIVGAGIEYFPKNRTSFKLEYLYAHFGTLNLNSTLFGNQALSGLSATFDDKLNNIAIQTLLLGINMHFA